MSFVHEVLMNQVGKLVSSEQAMKLLQNEAMMNAVLKAFTVSTEARQLMDTLVAAVMKSLKLVSLDELEPLRRNIERLEREVAELRAAPTSRAVVRPSPP